MKKVIPLIFILAPFFLLACEKAGHPPTLPETRRAPVEITAEVDKARATLGDILTLSILINWSQDLALEIPDFASLMTDFEVVDTGAGETLKVDGRKIQRRWIKLRAKELGSYRIPSLALSYKLSPSNEEGSEQTAPIFVEVESTLEGKDLEDLPNEIRPVIPILRNYKHWVFIAGALIMVGGLAYFPWRRRKKKKPTAVELPLPAHELALRQLENLKQIQAHDPEAVRKLYFDLSEVFRRYLQNRFKFPAVDWTTEEILPHILHHPEIQREMEEISMVFFQNTDRVKFARHFPGASEIGREFETAERFIHNTKEEIYPLHGSQPSETGELHHRHEN